MIYKVIRNFTDSNLKGAENGKLHVYHVGDKYPYKNYSGSTTKNRISELTKVDGPNESFDGPVIEELGE